MLKKLALILLCCSSVVCADSFWKKLTWQTPDGVRLAGWYHEASRPKAYTWILLHGLGSVKEEWDGFARELGAQGAGVFLYDARGHHESVRLRDGGMLSYKSFQFTGPGSHWDKMMGDLGSAVQLLEEKYEVDEEFIAVGGASLGANVALTYAANRPKVPALVLLSPGMDYAGIQSVRPFETYQGRPAFVAASPNDAYAYSSVRQLSSRFADSATRYVDGTSGHGVAMLEDKEFADKLLKWMKTP